MTLNGERRGALETQVMDGARLAANGVGDGPTWPNSKADRLMATDRIGEGVVPFLARHFVQV